MNAHIEIMPIPVPVLPFRLSLKFASLMCIMTLTLLIGYVFYCYSKRKWQQPHILNLTIPAMVAGLLFTVYGISMTSVKGLIFIFLLLYAANSDIKTREVSNWIPFAITITGLIEKELKDIPFMVLSAVIITLPQLYWAISKESSYGGADIKLMAACAFLLGLEGGLIAIIIGLSIGLITTVVKRKLKNESLKGKFPVLPCLAFGSFLSFLLI